MKKITLILLVIFLSFGAIADVAAQTKKSKYYSAKNRQQQQQRRYLRQKRQVARNYPRKSPPAIVPQATPSPSPGADNIQFTQPSPSPLPPANLTPVGGGRVEFPKPKLEKLSDDTLGGSYVVDVSANGNTVIKVGLAERAVALIDFPANDPVYKIHPGNENFVTVGCFGREPNGKCLNSPSDAIVLRPGKDFHSLGDEEAAATVITIQRVSGIVVTLLVVPVKKISENTNYVAVRYRLDDVLKTRRENGLPINMLGGETPAPNQTLPATAPGAVITVDDLISGDNSAAIINASQTTGGGGGDNPTDKTVSLDELLYNEIQRAAQNTSALKFTKPVYGIALARVGRGNAAAITDVTIEIVAVRNASSRAIRLVPEQPQLVIENRDSKDNSINIQAAPLLNVATTVEGNDVLLPGQIYYFAVAYESPILGVKQALRVSFAGREAADAPASILLSGINR